MTRYISEVVDKDQDNHLARLGSARHVTSENMGKWWEWEYYVGKPMLW